MTIDRLRAALADRYRIERELGAGGMATVYLAHMSVSVTPGPVPTFGAPKPLFSVAGYRGARNRQQYDVAPGDQRFLMIRNLNSEASREAVYVENWFTELKAKLEQ